MRILLGFAFSLAIAEAFMPLRSPTTIRSSLGSSPPMLDLELARTETAKKLKADYGSILLEKAAKDEFKAAVEELENKSEPPAIEDYADMFIGDWTLLCTTSVNREGVDTSFLPFLKQDPLKKIRDSIREAANKYILVQQLIKSSKNDGVIDRVDNTIEYEPPEQLRELIDNIPERLSQLNINPLHVSKSKLVLVHKATIESELPLKTKLALQSIVLNIAGNSTYLEPNGQDIAGLNLPLGEFIGTGTFETTYLDNDLRISRGKQGFADVLRVFVRTDKLIAQEILDDLVETVTNEIVDAELEDEPEIVAIDDEEEEDPPKPESDKDDSDI